MVADALRATEITSLDATPSAQLTAGEGAKAYDVVKTDYVTPTAAGLADTTSKYKLVRLPSNAKLKALTLSVQAAIETSTGLAIDVGAYYSDSTVDGTAVANQGVAISVNCFAAALTGFRSSAVADLNALAAFKPSLRNLPLWSALGLTSDPGGYIDVVAAVQAAATGAVSKELGARAAYAV